MHELVHVWLGASGVSNLEVGLPPDVRIERYSDAVAAEILAPAARVRELWRAGRALDAVVRQMTRAFKVSSLVVLRRLFDIGAIDWETYRAAYQAEEVRFRAAAGTGGDFYRTQRSRLSTRFASAVVADTLEGGTTWRDGMRLLGVKKPDTVRGLAERLGYPA
jgi:Zn-dependent peptidase ImmA (M78 family)